MTGKPFNIAISALLAQQCELDVGDFVWNGGDCHLCVNHATRVDTQLARTPSPYPTLRLRRRPASIFDYEPHPAIKSPVAV